MRTTKEERTRESARFLLKGLFEEEIDEENEEDMLEVPPSPETQEDLLLRFYKNCPKYTNDILDNVVNHETETFGKIQVNERKKFSITYIETWNSHIELRLKILLFQNEHLAYL